MAQPEGFIPDKPEGFIPDKSQDWRQKFKERYSAVVNPLTKSLAEFLGGGPQSPLPGGYREPTAEAIGQEIAETVIPQTPIQAGAEIPMLIAPFLRLPGLGNALGRILAGAAGGEAAGQLTGEPAGKGAMVGGSGTALGESTGKIVSAIARSTGSGRHLISSQDAKRWGEFIEEQAPPLQGARTAERIRDLAGIEGRKALSLAKEEVVQALETLPGLSGASLRITSLGGEPMTLRQANDALTQIGLGAFNQHILDRTAKKAADRALYGQVRQELQSAIDNASPGAGEAWNKVQGVYERGLAMQKIFSRPGMYRGTEVDILPSGQGRILDALKLPFRGANTGSTQFVTGPLRTIFPNLGAQYAQRGPIELNTTQLGRLGMDTRFREWLRDKLGPEGFNLFMSEIVRKGKMPLEMPLLLQSILDIEGQRGASQFLE